MSDKRVHRVSVFLNDREVAALSSDADAVCRELSDYLRFLAIERHRAIEEEHVAKLVAAEHERERIREASHALYRHQVPPSATVTAMQSALQRQRERERQPWSGRDDDGFPSTVGTGQQG